MASRSSRTPDFRDLLVFDLAGYLRRRGIPDAEAGKRAVELMQEVDKIADESIRHKEQDG